jgi:HK97 gp10 family phage protein
LPRGLSVQVSHSGIYDLVKELEKYTQNTDGHMRMVVYKGMEVVADKMRSEVEGLKTSKQYKTKGKRYCTENEKKGLVESFGVTPISARNYIFDANAGFDGYNEYVRSEPANPMIANFINRGTSYMRAQPFINRTKRVAETKAVEAMQKSLDDVIKSLQ